MAKMYGNWRGSNQNSKGWTKRAMRHDEERQIEKDVWAEQTHEQDCPHVLSIVDAIAGRRACHECHVLAGGESDG